MVAFAVTHSVTTGVSENTSQVGREVAHGASALAPLDADEFLFVPEKFDRDFDFRLANVHRQQFGNEGPQLFGHRFDRR
jgi:hypothetical protein